MYMSSTFICPAKFITFGTNSDNCSRHKCGQMQQAHHLHVLGRVMAKDISQADAGQEGRGMCPFDNYMQWPGAWQGTQF